MKMCKYTKSIVFFFALLAVSCSMQEKDFKDSRENPGKVFYASIEVPVGEAETKVYADDDLSVLWHEDDRVSIFNKNTYNQEYRFTGKTGSNAGSFEKVTSGGFVTGNPLSSVYSVYPYSASTEISNQGLISVDLPSTQTYAQHSFGPNANTMVSVSSDEMLLFKNVGGYLVLRLYGEDVEVSSITLKGNNNEKLAGKATVRIIAGENPSVDMSNDAAKEITLTCENPVTIGNTAAGYTEFWFVTPPVTFSTGITIRVNGPKGSFFEKSSSKAISVGRNTVSRMAAIEVELSGGEDGFVVFKDDNFKAYCVENFDTDNDGKISIDEALVVTEIWVSTTNIESLEGIEFFENLQQLTCSGGFSTHGKLTNLDISKNTALTSLWCSYNLLTSLDVSKNTELTELTCNNNLLTSLDVSKNTKLTYLNCYNQLYSSCNNQLTSLDLSNNSALTELYLDSNLLTSLDVSKNTELTVLSCPNNQLTSINVSNNTALTRLSCWKNQLTSINLSNNSALTELYLDSNLLTSLDVSKNTELTVLSCPNNQLASLDASKNTALTQLSCNNNQLSSLDVSKNIALTSLHCSNNLLILLDVSNNRALATLECDNNPFLTEIWLRMGQSIQTFYYDSSVSQIKRKEIKIEAVDLGLSVKWANANIGAGSEELSGNYYAWGETETKSNYDMWETYKFCVSVEYSTSNVKLSKYNTTEYHGTVDNLTVLAAEDDVAHVMLAGNWRLPTDKEWTELQTTCSWMWTENYEYTGIKGYIVTGLNGNSIFLPAAGCACGESQADVNFRGWYWSSSLSESSPTHAWAFVFDLNFIGIDDYYRRDGYTVRPVFE